VGHPQGRQRRDDDEGEVIRAIMEHDATLMEVDMNGEAKIEIITSHYRHHVSPFDYEDEDGVTHHSKGYECTRLEVYARTIEETK
jgi:hypothetical protein